MKEGQNLYEYDFIKEITKTKEGYPWEGRDKVVAYTYYEPRDWIIASGSCIEDFTQKMRLHTISLHSHVHHKSVYKQDDFNII